VILKKTSRAAKNLEQRAFSQVFWTTILGNFEVMSRARSAIWIATLRAMDR
jgi:hypothetical protein